MVVARLVLFALVCFGAAGVTAGDVTGTPAEAAVEQAASPLPNRLRLPLLSVDAVPAAAPACDDGVMPVVAVVVDPQLEPAIREQLRRFEADYCYRGYAVIERATKFASPPELRQYLAGLLTSTSNRLAGAVFVGDFPHAYQWVTSKSSNPSIPSTSEEALSLQYYQDLTGAFSASPGYVSPGGHAYSYDLHIGDVDWEIWVGVLPGYGPTLQEAATNLVRYFDKHHAFVLNGSQLPRAFLQVSEFYSATNIAEYTTFRGWMLNGQYAWTPFSTESGAKIYFDAPVAALSAAQGYTALSGGVADFAVLDAHGYWGASGAFTVARLRSEGVRAYFLWSNGCAVGNLDQPVNWLSEAIYAPSSMVLSAKGTTNNSGGMGTNAAGFFGHNVAQAMANGASVGDALKTHANVPLIFPWSESREFHMGTSVLLGDPTLELPGP